MSEGVERDGLDVLDSQDRARFEQLVLPTWMLHLTSRDG